ncbi:MAG TPA: hypothetical protein ENJ61_07815 [Aquifex aeolicus]|uniref:Uncharacterized protein n=1 Tax=Aquifex aeolicus TaxID=63363 RepID=A0A7C5Q5M4_AQUAO|nr:hypothetical protein [Aquifex aeolicus]
MMKLRGFLLLLTFSTLSLFLTACGGGGGGGGDGGGGGGQIQQPDPAESNIWNQMEWDKGTWAE